MARGRPLEVFGQETDNPKRCFRKTTEGTVRDKSEEEELESNAIKSTVVGLALKKITIHSFPSEKEREE